MKHSQRVADVGSPAHLKKPLGKFSGRPQGGVVWLPVAFFSLIPFPPISQLPLPSPLSSPGRKR